MERPCYWVSLAVYLMNTAVIVLAYIFPLGALYAAVVFPPVLVSFGLFIWHMNCHSAGHIPGHVPNWSKVLVVLAVIYAAVNFAVNICFLANGGPELVEGLPCRNNHGQVVQITWEEYNRLQRAESRLFSGHTWVFAALSFGYFSGVKNSGRDA